MKTHKIIGKDAERAVAALYLAMGTWRKVSAYLSRGRSHKLDCAMLARIGKGLQSAPNSVRIVLGLPVKMVEVPVCLKCATPHTPKRFSHRLTFEERQARSDAWVQARTARIESIVAWADIHA